MLFFLCIMISSYSSSVFWTCSCFYLVREVSKFMSAQVETNSLFKAIFGLVFFEKFLFPQSFCEKTLPGLKIRFSRFSVFFLNRFALNEAEFRFLWYNNFPRKPHVR